MKIYSCTDAPLTLHGLDHVKPQEKEYWRLGSDILEQMPHYDRLGKRCGGGRVRFATDSAQIWVRYTLKTLSVDIAIPLTGSAGMDIYYGTGREAHFGGIINPKDYETMTVEKTFEKNAVMEVVTINLPRNEQLASLEIGLDDAARVEAAPYAIPNPIVFYGSSITEGGCAPRSGLAYTSMVARWLDADYINYGFSGNAKGEECFARYIAQRKDIPLFVYDYDHNAPSPEHLEQTHEPFLRIVRKQHPTVPIIMMSRPDFRPELKDNIKRRQAVYATYAKVVEAGDRNIYFVDGEQFFGEEFREECTVDGCHPNALGFVQMARTVYPLAKRLLKA